MVKRERGWKILGEAGIFIIVSDVCYLLAYIGYAQCGPGDDVIFVCGGLRVFSHSASYGYATRRPKRLRGCAFLRYKVNPFYSSGPKVS